MLKLVSKGINISRRDVIYALKLVKEDKLNRIDELYNVKITKTASGKMIYPKTLGQKEYYYAWNRTCRNWKDIFSGCFCS